MKRDKLKKASHVIAALIFILLAFYVFETPNIIIAFSAVGLGIIFLIVAGLHDWLMTNYKNISVLFILIEAALMFAAAYLFFIKKHSTLYKVMTAPAVIFLIGGIYFFATKKRSRGRHRLRKSTSVKENLLLLALIINSSITHLISF